MGTIPATALRPCMVRLVKLLASWEPHFSCAQQLLAERMITIVAHFCTQVVKFIFGGRNSGQQGREVRSLRHSNAHLARTDSRAAVMWATRPSVAALRVVHYHVPGDGKYAGLSLELDPISGIGRKLHLPGLGP
jgi:hypothetical protein